MKSEDKQFLQDLIEHPSPSGYEQPVAEVLRNRLAKSADSVETNEMGSVHGTLKGSGEAPSVIVAAHIDEIGFMVSYIDDDGFIYFKAVGGIDAAILPGLRVDLYATGSGKTEKIRGVLGRKPIHLLPPEERKDVTPIDKLHIDLMLDKEEVKKRVRIGDIATFGVGFEESEGGLAVSRAFDDKSCVWVGTRVLEELKKLGKQKADYTFAGTVQEEIGLRGGQTSGYAVNADVNIAIDVTHATDYPGIEKSKYGDIKLGAGPVISRGPNINPVLFDRLVAAAEKAQVPYQIEAQPRGTGTDANAMQLNRGGKATALLSVPLRYMHTPTEVISLEDLENTVKLLTQFVADLDESCDFVPHI